MAVRRDPVMDKNPPLPSDPVAILLVWLGALFLALFVTPNYQQAGLGELLYYSVYNVAAGALVGFFLFDRIGGAGLLRFAAFACLALVAGTLVNEALVEASLFRTGPINFEGVYYGLLESATAATLFLLLRMLKTLGGRGEDAGEPGRPVDRGEGGHFFVRVGSETRRIAAADVIYLKAERDYSHIVCADGRYFASESLKELLEKAAPFGLVRVHKSFAVNLRRVDWLTRTEAGLSDERIPVGRRYRQPLAEAWREGRPPSEGI